MNQRRVQNRAWWRTNLEGRNMDASAGDCDAGWSEKSVPEMPLKGEITRVKSPTTRKNQGGGDGLSSGE